MALRGKAPMQIRKRLKCLLSGEAGVGKTTSSISMPRPYLIDCERGAENPQYVKAIEAAGGAIFQTVELADVVEEVKNLLVDKHPFRTLVIDPITVVYNEALDTSARQLAAATLGDSDGTEFGRHKRQPDRAARHLLNLCMRLDMNVVLIAHSKALWEGEGNKRRQVGTTFDGYGKLDYAVDLWLDAEMRGEQRIATVKKSRIEGFRLYETLPLSYAEIARRYGKEELEAEAVPRELATPEQVSLINHLVATLKIPDSVTDKWLAKGEAESFDELPRAAAEKCVEWLQAKLVPGTNGATEGQEKDQKPEEEKADAVSA